MQTIIDLFENSVEKYADNPFMWEKRQGKYEPTSYKQTLTQVEVLANGLLSIGVKPNDHIALLSEGRNQWIVSELGILYTGAVNIPLSIKLEANEVLFRINHSESRFLVVSNQQSVKIDKIKKDFSHVEKIIYLDEENLNTPEAISLDELIKSGKKYKEAHNNELQNRKKEIEGDHWANITYTSGTTSDPKGIILTHRNYTANVDQAYSLMDIPESYKTLLILPLDHCFAHVAGIYSFMGKGASLAMVESGKNPLQTLKNIPVNIKEIKPDLLLSVPALAKNFKKNIDAGIKAKGKTMWNLYQFALKNAYKYNKEGFNKGVNGSAWRKPLVNLFDKILFEKVRAFFFFFLKFFIGGGALLDIELQRYFYAIGIPMMQGYGLSEATPIISSNALHKHKLGSSGFLVNDLELKICDDEGREVPQGEKGEIVVKGENVMYGYWKNDNATTDTIKNGWLHTGDMRYIEKDNVQNKPYTIEINYTNYEEIKSALRNDNLSKKKKKKKKQALQLIQSEINHFRKGGRFEGEFPERWLPSAIAVLEEGFNEQNKMMNSTMKIVRGKVTEFYRERIDYLYNKDGKGITNEINMKALEKISQN